MFKLKTNIEVTQDFIIRTVIFILKISTLLLALFMPFSAIPIICIGLLVTELIEFIYCLFK